MSEYSQTYCEAGLRQSRLWPAGTLCITIAANVAETAFLDVPGCFPDSIVGFSADLQSADATFVKYLVDFIRPELRAISRGATQDNLPLDKLLSFQVSVPPLQDQRKIAAILSAHDELVQNSLDRRRALNAMVEALYHEWFERYRYPNAGESSLIRGSSEELPSGFRVEPLASAVEFVRGTEPGSRHYRDSPAEGLVRFYRVGDLSESPRSPVWVAEDVANARLERSDVVISLDGTVGLVRTRLLGAYSSSIRKVVPTDPHLGRAYLLAMLMSSRIQSTIRAHATGTTIVHASAAIGHMTYVRPPDALLAEFELRCRPLLALGDVLSEQIMVLEQELELLLTRLLSGGTDVSGLNVATGRLSP